MPYPSEHAARLRDPEDFARIAQLWENGGVRCLGGPLKSDPSGPTVPQSIRFDADRFTPAEARKWLADHELSPLSFEPATGSARAAAGGLAYLEAPIDLTAAAAAASSGAPPRFRAIAYNGGPLRVAGYPLPVVVDLEGLDGVEPPKPILRDHVVSQAVGHADRIVVANGQIVLEGLLSNVTSAAAQEVIAAAKNGFPWAASIGVAIERLVEVPRGSTVRVNGREQAGPVLVARRGTLREISLVAVGADAEATVRIAASAISHRQEFDTMEFEQWLQSKGFLLAELKDEQKTFLKSAFDAELKATADAQAEEPSEPPKDRRKSKAKAGTPDQAAGAPDLKAQSDLAAKMVFDAAAEAASRVAKIRKAFDGRHPDLEAKAIAEQWSDDKIALEILKAERPTGPAIHVSQRDMSPRVMEAALCLNAKLQIAEKEYDAKTLEAASVRELRGMGIQEVLMRAAWENGYDGAFFRESELRSILKAAFSSLSLPGILSNVANKFLLESFNSVEQTWREISRIRPVKDFKQVTSYRLTGNVVYSEVGPTGEITHGTVAEESYTNQARTYARMFGLTRQDIVNDDLGAFAEIPRMLGRGAGRKLNDVFWTEFLNNSSFFTTDRGNYFSGASTNLQESSLATAVQMFRDLKDTDGTPLAIAPALLLVPTTLEVTARKLYSSTEIRDTTSSTRYPTANVFQNMYRPIVSAYLANSAYTGYSTTAWYLLATAAEMPVMEVAFLNGQENPTVESSDADFDTLGIQYRGYHDFGVTKAEYRGGVKSKGAA